MSEQPKQIRLGRNGSIVSDTPVPEISGSDDVNYYGGHLMAESVSPENARRLVACWNACDGLDIDLLARFGLGTASGSEIFKLHEQRGKLLQLLEHAKHLINISTGKQSKLRAMKAIDEAIANVTKEAA